MKKNQFTAEYKYYPGQTFQKNDPDNSFPKYIILELRYSAKPWSQDRVTFTIEGDYGKLSFQGGLNAPLQEIVFKQVDTGELTTRTAAQINKYRKNNQLIF